MTADVSRERTRNYFQQIKGSVVYKALAMLASFLAIPLMIQYLGEEQFGVWSTLLTVMSWIVFFDLGVGNGLRNKVAEALAKNDKLEAAQYISSGYSLIGLMALLVWAVVTGVSYFLPWQAIFNTQAISEDTLRLTVQVGVFFVVLNFWIGLICAILGAVQKTSITALGQLISNFVALLFVFLLTKKFDASIIHLAWAYGASLVIANLGLSWWFFHVQPELRPKPSLESWRVRPLLGLGFQFFAIQIAVLIIFTTDKILITQLFGPEYVTQYDIVFKLFSVITFAHTLISAPLWSAYTDAYHRSDFVWIRNMLNKQLKIYFLVTIATLGLIIFARSIINLWIGYEFEVPFSLLMFMGLLILISVWNNIFGVLLGGIGKIRLGSIYTIFTALLNIPLSYLMAINFEFGVSGVVLGTMLSIALSSIIGPIQVYFFIYARNKNTTFVNILR